ncbi:uncharacterized protein BO72DRAFT_493881 [Aspergillus fijiensis CBS 313.89]|uniref:(S)-ureidoglycine aminohydrolase cupin domain-containing protein n=1 Tax=Aspergillus fijiensis CBS 313.89 TaxID=1448319 RepID=A0A8G1RYD4_9EURO|nr:uncharacterized protein BO72DRAFT_493881 [Aspergillus fijiensis CBS 313.89]RAK80050.1 hypothetical protein BO72DRAFT_493881 [Aspergillus fijiensis CBS 313.89]
MVLQVKGKVEAYKLPNYGSISNVFFDDLLGTEKRESGNPIVGSWFRIEKGPEATPPEYTYDEVGIVIEGEINLRDETGQTATVRPGDTFFFPRGSTITFSSDSYGVAWKCGGRLPAKL